MPCSERCRKGPRCNRALVYSARVAYTLSFLQLRTNYVFIIASDVKTAIRTVVGPGCQSQFRDL